MAGTTEKRNMDIEEEPGKVASCIEDLRHYFTSIASSLPNTRRHLVERLRGRIEVIEENISLDEGFRELDESSKQDVDSEESRTSSWIEDLQGRISTAEPTTRQELILVLSRHISRIQRDLSTGRLIKKLHSSPTPP